MNKTSKIAIFSAFLTTGAVAAFYAAGVANAQGFEPLTNVPGIFKQGETTNPIKLLSGLYGFAIGIGAVIAVVMIIYSGFEYMYQESVFSKSEAKSRIINAFAGLALILGSYIILRTINTDLVNFNLALPGGTGKVSGLIASQANTDTINKALHDAATNSSQRIEDINTLKSTLTQDLSKLEALKKQPQTAERDSQISSLQAQIDQTKISINQKTIAHKDLTNADIITKAKDRNFDLELSNLNTLVGKDDLAKASSEAQASLLNLFDKTSNQISILNNNMNDVAKLETTGELSAAKESFVLKTGQDIAYLGATKTMLIELYKSTDYSSYAPTGVKNQSLKFDEIITTYTKQASDFELSGRKDLAENLRNDISKATEIMKIRQKKACNAVTNVPKETITLCK